MAVVGNTAVTLRDLQKTFEGGKIAEVIEVLNEKHDISDFKFKEGNLMTGNVTTRRAALPTISKRRINVGTTPSKNTNTQVSDTACISEAYSEVDDELIKLHGDGDASSQAGKAFRWTEDMGFIEAMHQDFLDDFIYGDESTDDTECTGLAARRATPSTSRTDPGYYMIDGGGTGSDNASMYLVPWGDRTVHCMYPKGTKAGLEIEDLGKSTKEDSVNNKLMEVWRTHFIWRYGVVERDYRSIVRIANIDVSALRAGTGADLIELMIIAEHISRGMGAGSPVWYVPEVVATYLDIQTLSQTQTNVSYATGVHGEQVLKFRNKKVCTLDALTEAEATITGTFAHG